MDINSVLFGAADDVKIKILEQRIEFIKNPLSGIKQDPTVRFNMMKVGKMLHDQEKTYSGKITAPML